VSRLRATIRRPDVREYKKLEERRREGAAREKK
jgi:hypothetical protein